MKPALLSICLYIHNDRQEIRYFCLMLLYVLCVVMRVLVSVIGPVLMVVGMHRADGRKFAACVGMITP
jgi:hypothetical protein